MPVNQLRFEESSEIVIDARSVTPNAGWTISYLSAIRIGALVALHIEATGPGAGPVCTLPPDFAPGQSLTSGDANFTVSSAGVLAATGTTLIGDVVYLAGAVSP
jgi:hypothetical protein